MAIVKGPALSLEASGNLGAICYSRWRQLQIARDTWTGTYESSSRRDFVNNVMKDVSQYWKVLTPEEREAWEEVAREERWKTRLGGDFIPTGYQLFCKINCTRRCTGIGTGILVEPPRLPKPVYVGVWEVRMSTAWPRVVVSLRAGHPWIKLVSDGFQIFRAGPYNSGGRHALEGEYRWLTNSTAAYYDDSAVVEFKWYWYKARWYYNEGFVGNWFEAQIKVVFP